MDTKALVARITQVEATYANVQRAYQAHGNRVTAKTLADYNRYLIDYHHLIEQMMQHLSQRMTATDVEIAETTRRTAETTRRLNAMDVMDEANAIILEADRNPTPCPVCEYVEP